MNSQTQIQNSSLPGQGKPLIRALTGQAQTVPPLWLMRQAGRYLPEYRELRKQAGGFLDLVYNPAFAAEVTIQPIRRFGMDAAILFSDILVIPQALGQHLEFREGDGPRLNPIRSAAEMAPLSFANFEKTLSPIYETIRTVRAQLNTEGFSDTALIGFAGAPWTIACYMVDGGGSRDFAETKKWAYRDPDGFGRLIDLITEATAAYLIQQIDHGAEAVQLFDSWAGACDEGLFRRYCIQPAKTIVNLIRASHPDVPIIGFPRQAGRLALDYVQGTGVNAIGIDQMIPMRWAAQSLQPLACVQGNLDPVCLLTGGDAMRDNVQSILDNLAGGPFVFNLGHGIIKETPPDHVAQLVAMVREYSTGKA